MSYRHDGVGPGGLKFRLADSHPDQVARTLDELTQRKDLLPGGKNMGPCNPGADIMHYRSGYLFAIFTIWWTSSLNAMDISATLKTEGCLTCHHETRTGVGPSFKAMATRRCVDAQAASKHFVDKLRNGVGHPKAKMSDGQLVQLSDWICSLRQD